MDPLAARSCWGHSAIPTSSNRTLPELSPAASAFPLFQLRSSVPSIRKKPVLPDPVRIKAVLRPMQGGSQSHLVEAEDGRFYVAKFAPNPQGNRTLLNEWIGCRILRACEISTPEMRILELTPEVAGSHAQLRFQRGEGSEVIKPGLHLGSQYPANPHVVAVFDYLPVQLLDLVANIEDFTRAYVLDHLLGQADRRQVVFTREQKSWTKLDLRAWMIDHGMLFGGTAWKIRDMPLQGLYIDRGVYSRVDFWAICQETVACLQNVVEEAFWRAVHGAPAEWFGAKDRSEVHHLLASINARIEEWPEILATHKKTLDNGNGRTNGKIARLASTFDPASVSETLVGGTLG